MAGAGVGERALGEIEHAAEQRHEHQVVVALAQLGVEAGEDALRIERVARGAFQMADHARHEQRRRHALVGDVAKGEAQMAGVVAEHAVEVAADAARRHQPRAQGEAAAAALQRAAAGQHAALDFARGFQLAVEARARLHRRGQLGDVRLQRGAHAVDAARELAELVLAVDRRQRRVEVAAGDALEAGVQRAQRQRDAATDADREPAQRQQAEQRQHAHAAQQPLRAAHQFGVRQCRIRLAEQHRAHADEHQRQRGQIDQRAGQQRPERDARGEAAEGHAGGLRGAFRPARRLPADGRRRGCACGSPPSAGRGEGCRPGAAACRRPRRRASDFTPCRR
uniref:Uncharacterized protein n=1 Tax=Mizugakiibacter sediminis TaxID=1475481 RepID=A0A0U1P9V5_9GAMM